jgi:hypothetical protein
MSIASQSALPYSSSSRIHRVCVWGRILEGHGADSAARLNAGVATHALGVIGTIGYWVDVNRASPLAATARDTLAFIHARAE